ncbi:MAG: hypothetical protein IT366_09190 [Candidatus Hydrogenedentes bacterium]|nr:hypothetical protein [Candidatus Hydrogenedentota bacterium]
MDRIAFGPWMNDTRTSPLPFSGWPPDVFDDVTVDSILRTLDLNQAFGYNIYDVFGLFATYGWPVDIESAATPERAKRVRRIIRSSHERGLKIICGMGVYSWGFDEIIKAHPEVARKDQLYPNEHVMCGSREESWTWQKKLVDFMMKWEMDGFHLEAADLGRCTCPECMTKWPNQADYFCEISKRTAEYIREKMPDAYILVTTISWVDWNLGFNERDRDALVQLSKTVDCIFDQGHHGSYVRPPDRKPFIERLNCRWGTSGGLWVYPTYTWDRLQYFLPYPRQTGEHMKSLFDDGGRGVMYYQGPSNNPGVEINIAFGGEFMCHPQKSIEDNLGAVLERIYQPKSPEALSKLTNLVFAAEDAYFKNMDWDAEHRYLKGNKLYPGPGELHLSRPITGLYGTPDYLLEPQMTLEGRIAYNVALEGVLKEAYAIGNQFDATEKMELLQTAILNTLMMLRACVSTQQWQEQRVKTNP